MALSVLVAAPTHASAAPAATQQFAQTCGNPGTPGAVHHVIWIWMENENYNSVIGNANAPYQTGLAHQCGLPTNFHNESHASLDNYIAATNGQSILGTSFVNDCLPTQKNNACVSSAPSIFSQLDAAGETWRNYNEDMPTNCDQANSGNYAVRHNPAVYYSPLPTCAQDDIAMGSAATQTGPFYDDVRNGTLPNFTFITPNLADDAHNTNAAAGDAWLSNLVPFITSNPNYQSGDTTIFITNDEGGGSDYAINEDCTNQALDASQTSCHIPTIVIAPYTHTGTVDGSFYTHYSMLRTAEELLGVPLLGASASALSMTSSFNLGPVVGGAVAPSAPSSLTATASSSTQVSLGWSPAIAGSAPIAGYQVSRNGAVIAATAATSYTDSAVTPGTTYSYTVTAVDSNGLVGAASNTATTTTPGTTNLLTNPGFETWSGGVATGWNVYGGALATMTQSSDAHSGASSVRLATTNAGYAASGLNDGSKSTISSTVPGVTYTASCWAKASAANALTVKIQLHETKQNGTSVSDAAISSLLLPTSTNWYQLQVSYTTVAAGDKVPMSIYTTGTKSGGATWEVDDCSLAQFVPVTTVPGAPGPLTASPNGTGEIDLSWSAATGATLYDVQRGPAGSGTFPTDLGSVTLTSFANIGLSPGSSFSYRVVPSNSAGAGPPSNTATATTVPAQVSGLTATAVSASEVDLSWSPVTGATSYLVQRAPHGTTTWTTVSSGSPATNFADTTVSAGTSYDYQVAAAGAAGGSGQFSASQTATTPAGTPGKVTGLAASAASTTEIDLSWTATAGATAYEVDRSATSASAGFSPLATGLSTPTFADVTAAPQATYWYQVIASNPSGPGPASDAVSTTTLPDQVTGVTATVVSASEIDLSWNAAAGAVTYTLRRAPSGTTTWTTVSAGASGTSINDTTVSPGTSYDYQVAAVNAGGVGAFSATQTAATPLIAPGQVTGVQATAASSTEIDLSWTPTPGATGYEVDRSTTSATSGFSPLMAGLTTASFADTTASAQTTYWYEVIASNSAGPGPASVAAPATTLPGQVTGLIASAVSAAEIDLSWNAVPAANSYLVQRAPHGTTTWTTVSSGSAATTFADTTVGAGTSYDYQVAAVGAGGTGAFSAIQTATTPAVAPGQVTGLHASVASTAEIDLTWTSTPGATGYEVDRSTTSATAGFTPLATGLATPSFADTTTASHTTYWYQVIASNSTGPGPASAAATATTPPNQVTGLSATAASPSEIDLSWIGVTGATSYLVQRAPHGTTTWATVSSASSATTFADTTVSAGTSYDYQVAAVGAGGSGVFSATQTATTPALNPPLLSNGFEGGVSGAAITAAGSGGASGNAFNAVSCTGGSATYTASADHGVRAAAFTPTTAACFVQWGTNSIPTSTTSYGRMYVNLSNPIGPTVLLAKLANSAVARDAQIDLSSAGKLALYDANGAVKQTFATTVPTGWVRIEWKLVNSTTAGSLTVSMYSGDGLTPIETHTLTGINTGASFGALQVGSVVATTAVPAPFRIDDVAYGTTGPLGPAH